MSLSKSDKSQLEYLSQYKVYKFTKDKQVLLRYNVLEEKNGVLAVTNAFKNAFLVYRDPHRFDNWIWIPIEGALCLIRQIDMHDHPKETQLFVHVSILHCFLNSVHKGGIISHNAIFRDFPVIMRFCLSNQNEMLGYFNRSG
jgi:hypothetical protein